MIKGVPVAEFWAYWPHVKDHFASFQERSGGFVTAAELVQMVLQARRQMWVAEIGGEVKACALTELVRGAGLVLVLDFCAGQDREEWRDDMVAEIERWADHLGAGMRIVCRPGWARELKGYRETHRVLEKRHG